MVFTSVGGGVCDECDSGGTGLKPTDIKNPNYFHKVVDCQWACPAHTPVPEYIRLIAQGRYDDAYMINWYSNVFPGVPGARVIGRASRPAGAGVSRTVRARNRLRFAV